MIHLIGNLYSVEVPSDATKIQTWNHGIGFKTNMLDRKPDDTNGFYHIETGLFKMKGFKMLGEVTKDEISFFVDDYVGKEYLEVGDTHSVCAYKSIQVFKDYQDDDNCFETANESFQSLLQSKGIDLNKENVKLIILEKL